MLICINNNVVLFDYMDINQFINLLNEQIYNDESEQVVKCLEEYIYDLWERDNKITEMIHKHIEPHIFPVFFINVDVTEDISKVDVQAMSQDKSYKEKKSDAVKFNQFCDKYLKSLKPLYDRLVELNLG